MTDTDNTQPQDDEAQQWYDELAKNRFAAATAIRRATEEAEAAKACEQETAADLATERAAHEEHRRWLALLLDLPKSTEWLTVTRVATEHRQDRDRLAAELTAARAENDGWAETVRNTDRLTSQAFAAERAAHEQHRRALCEAMGGNLVDWPEAIGRVRKGIADRDGLRAELAAARERYKAGLRKADEDLRAMNAELERYADGLERPVLWSVYNRMHSRADTAEATVRDYENRITWETTCGEHARLLDSCRKADERAEEAEAALTRVRDAAQLHRQGLIEYTELYAAIDGPMDPVHILGAEPNSTRGGDQPAESQPDDGDRVVAYRSSGGRVLRCLDHAPSDLTGFAPVTSEDLPDGGICYSCGVDVLAEAQPERCGQYAGHGEYCDYPREPGGELCAVHSAEQVREQPEPKRSGIFAGVQGHCPACGRTALILGTGGYVTCGNLDCPQPDAATTLLEWDVREQPAEPPLRGPSADAAPHIAFAISSYLAALVPLADALRDALGEQR